MAFTRSTTTTNVHSTLGNYPAEDNHLTAEQLKERFDAPATGLKSDINRLETELEATTSASSLGAGLITPGDTSAGNVQAKLEKIYTDLQAAALGEIPDNSVEERKLVSTYANTLAKKSGTVQTNLNADMLDGYHASSFALKNNTLQTGLNAEKLGGSTKAQIIEQITERTSASDQDFLTSSLGLTEISETKTLNVSCRFILVFLGTTYNNRTFTPNDRVGLFDCRRKQFLFTFDSSGDYTYFAKFANNMELRNNKYTEYGYIYGGVRNFQYSNGVLTFQLYGRLSANQEVSNNWQIGARFIQLDGLLP